jgi:hypothetical protein
MESDPSLSAPQTKWRIVICGLVAWNIFEAVLSHNIRNMVKQIFSNGSFIKPVDILFDVYRRLSEGMVHILSLCLGSFGCNIVLEPMKSWTRLQSWLFFDLLDYVWRFLNRLFLACNCVFHGKNRSWLINWFSYSIPCTHSKVGRPQSWERERLPLSINQDLWVTVTVTVTEYLFLGDLLNYPGFASMRPKNLVYN